MGKILGKYSFCGMGWKGKTTEAGAVRVKY